MALGTVKKHLNNIFGKLGVSNRTECVARARELNLLCPPFLRNAVRPCRPQRYSARLSAVKLGSSMPTRVLPV